MVRAAVAEEAAAGPLVAAPDFPFDNAAEDAQSNGTKALLVEARHLTAACNETRTPDAFVTLLDFAYLAVHNGNLDSRDNSGLRSLYDWTREVGHGYLRRWIEAGNDAALLCEMGWDPAVPVGTKLRERAACSSGWAVTRVSSSRAPTCASSCRSRGSTSGGA